MTANKSMNTEPTIEECLRELREIFPDALRIYISDDADYFDGVLTRESFIMVTHNTFRAPTLSEAMAHVRQWHKENKPNG
jgi:hypothetical protein